MSMYLFYLAPLPSSFYCSYCLLLLLLHMLPLLLLLLLFSFSLPFFLPPLFNLCLLYHPHHLPSPPIPSLSLLSPSTLIRPFLSLSLCQLRNKSRASHFMFSSIDSRIVTFMRIPTRESDQNENEIHGQGSDSHGIHRQEKARKMTIRRVSALMFVTTNVKMTNGTVTAMKY